MADPRPEVTPQQSQYISDILKTLGGVRGAIGEESARQNVSLKQDISLVRQAIFEDPELSKGFSTSERTAARERPLAGLQRQERLTSLQRGQGQRLMQAMVGQESLQSSIQMESRFRDLNMA